MATRIQLLIVSIVGLAFVGCAPVESPHEFAWASRPRTTWLDDEVLSMAADDTGCTYIAWRSTDLSHLFEENEGREALPVEQYLSKFDRDGHEVWVRPLGSDDWAVFEAIAVDSAGNIYATGSVDDQPWRALMRRSLPRLFDESLDYEFYEDSDYDAFVAKFDMDGRLLWMRRAPTTGADPDAGLLVALDGGGNVHVVTRVQGVLEYRRNPRRVETRSSLNKLDPAGEEIWTAPIALKEGEWLVAMTVDARGNTYFVGRSRVSGSDTFVKKLDAEGNEAWTSILGSDAGDELNGVAADAAGNVYVAGSTGGELGGPNMGLYDAILSKFTPAGQHAWTRQIGTHGNDYGYGVVVDDAGDIYITASLRGGCVTGEIEGDTLLLAKYDAQGRERWSSSAELPELDRHHRMVMGSRGDIYVGTSASKCKDGSYYIPADVMVVKFAPPSEEDADTSPAE